MPDVFIGSLMLVGFDFAPRGYALCQGQLLSISQNTALFALLGTAYGGNGTTTFGLPNLQGSLVVSQGQGPGLSDYVIGQSGGETTVTLNGHQVPSHQHSVMASKGGGNNGSPNGTSLAETKIYAAPGSALAPMQARALGGAVGNGGPHDSMMPYQGLNWIIATGGISAASMR